MKSRRVTVFLIALTSLVLTSLVLCSCSSKLKATTIRLVRQEGTIELTGDDGKARSLKDQQRFMNGDALRTRVKSLAGLSLDDAKAVLMNEESCAEFHQENKGKFLEIDLTEGDLFFSVDEKLKDDENFEIHTSTMVIGIRGTSGYVTADAQGRDVLIVTEGTVHVSGINPQTGEIIEEDVSAGTQVTVYLFDRPTESVKFHLEHVAEKDLQPFALFSVTEEEPRLEKVCRATGWDPDLLRKYAGEFPEAMQWLSDLRTAEESGTAQNTEESTENTPAESGGVADETEESSSSEETTAANTRETLAGRNTNQTTAAANSRQTTQAAGQNTNAANGQNTATAVGSETAANTAGTAETAANTANTATPAATDNTAANTSQTTSSDTLDNTSLSGSGPSGNSSTTDDVDFDPNEDDEDTTEAATQAQTATQTQAATQAQTEARTQAQTEAQTQAQTAADGSDSAGSDTAGSDTAGADAGASDTAGSDSTGSDTAGADAGGSDTSGTDATSPEDPGADYYSMMGDTP